MLFTRPLFLKPGSIDQPCSQLLSNNLLSYLNKRLCQFADHSLCQQHLPSLVLLIISIRLLAIPQIPRSFVLSVASTVSASATSLSFTRSSRACVNLLARLTWRSQLAPGFITPSSKTKGLTKRYPCCDHIRNIVSSAGLFGLLISVSNSHYFRKRTVDGVCEPGNAQTFTQGETL